jgi:hypothetical protein
MNSDKMKRNWPAVTHIDAYMILGIVDGHIVEVAEISNKNELKNLSKYLRLVIANIGYYKAGRFSEFHNLLPIIIKEGEKIVDKLKVDPEYLEGQLLDPGSRSHLDDRHDITNFDVDDVVDVQENITDFAVVLSRCTKYNSSRQIKTILKTGYMFPELKKM